MEPPALKDTVKGVSPVKVDDEMLALIGMVVVVTVAVFWLVVPDVPVTVNVAL